MNFIAFSSQAKLRDRPHLDAEGVIADQALLDAGVRLLLGHRVHFVLDKILDQEASAGDRRYRLRRVTGCPVPLLPHLADAIDGAILVPHPTNVTTELGVAAHAWRAAVGIAPPGAPLVIHRRGNRQHRADRLDPIHVAVSVDEAHHHLARRSSSACAKYADAFLRISLARRSSKFSRSSCLRRSRSSVVRPGRLPASRSAWRTHFRSVSAVQPIFSAIEVIAAHCDSCAASCSTTIRTARDRTSGETSWVSAWPHPLKAWSLRETRRGSLRSDVLLMGSTGLPSTHTGASSSRRSAVSALAPAGVRSW